tara:strand:- start:15463 stop:16293 length:831 start_codon:yes stop_codon:yes gene_type:complete
MKLKLVIAVLVFLTTPFFMNAQETEKKDKKIKAVYFHWGYNRSAYTKADIKIKGDNEDIIIRDAYAKDSPSPFDASVYLNPLKFTIPQFDFRVGAELQNGYYVSFGWDHMKYVLQPGNYFVEGEITEPTATPKYIRSYNDTIFIDDNFLHLEHTDGLNYIHFSIDKVIYKKAFWKERLIFELPIEYGFGISTPWTDSEFVGRFYRNPSIRLAGVATNIGIKPRLYLYKELLFFQTNLRAGYVNMWNVKIHDEVRAKQNFGYVERAFVFGMKFNLKD